MGTQVGVLQGSGDGGDAAAAVAQLKEASPGGSEARPRTCQGGPRLHEDLHGGEVALAGCQVQRREPEPCSAIDVPAGCGAGQAPQVSGKRTG